MIVNKRYKFKKIIVNDNDIEVDDVDGHLSVSDDVIENAVLTYKDNLLHVIGNEQDFQFNYRDEIDPETVEDRYVRTGKKFTFFGKKFKYVKQGWYLLKKRKPYYKVLSEFTIDGKLD